MIDLKWLTSQCEEDAHPLLHIEDMPVTQTKAGFMVIDLKDAFHQMPMHLDIPRYTRTGSTIGMHWWRVLPMG